MQFKNSGKQKAVTFSYDDGTVQDIFLTELFNKYGLKATFNLNSGVFGKNKILIRQNQKVCFYRIHAEDVKYVYEGHELAVHTLTHPRLPELDDEEVIRQVEQDRLNLSELAGREVVGMAYPCAGINYDDRVDRLIRENSGIRYARTGKLTESFDPQVDLMHFKPNLHHFCDWNRMMELTRRFVEMKADRPQILYIYGHSFEMELGSDCWAKMEELLAYLANRDDIFYGTNQEVLL